jgi:hypothetical protein
MQHGFHRERPTCHRTRIVPTITQSIAVTADDAPQRQIDEGTSNLQLQTIAKQILAGS